MQVEVKIPQLSESVSEATLVAWRKKAGEAVRRDENLIDVETDKVVLELPAPSDGVLVKIVKNDGDSVTSGEVIAVIDTEGKVTASGAAVTPAKAGAQSTASAAAVAPAQAGVHRARRRPLRRGRGRPGHRLRAALDGVHDVFLGDAATAAGAGNPAGIDLPVRCEFLCGRHCRRRRFHLDGGRRLRSYRWCGRHCGSGLRF